MVKRILIADDSEGIRTVLKGIFSLQGFEIVGEAVNGREAFELYKLTQPDLVCMDLLMPEVTGLQALKDIIDYDSKAKVIIITAMGKREAFIETMKAGAVDHIVKPFDKERVLLAVQKALGE